MTYRRNRLLLIALFALLVLLKIPSLMEGRLWAEDGLFLTDALRLPWWQALTTPHTGYIDVTASTAMLVATHLVDLPNVPLISVGMALLIQVCPAILLVTSRCWWLQSWAMIVALLLVLLPPLTSEIWLSPVTSQYHLMLCTGLILGLDLGSGRRILFQNFLLGVAGLTGPGPALVAPLFVLRAWIDRSWPRAIQAMVISAGALIEVAIFCTHPEVNRHLSIGLPLFLQVIYLKHILVPLLGLHAAFVPINELALAVPLLFFGLAFAALKSQSREVPWLFAAAMTMMVLSYLGSLGTKAELLNVFFGQRYYYAPQVLIGLTLLGVARTGQPKIMRSVASALTGWLILVGTWEFRRVNPDMAHGPSWHDQVVKGARSIVLWPPTFHIQLDGISAAGRD
jgi:hypothetical protein